jgi:serine-type D-Ala-D-Ala carboxypeptidase
VSDENSYALGGIAGHAGVFSDLWDMVAFVGMWGYAAQGQPQWTALVNATTQATYFTNPRPSFGPRALGWVTQAATDTYLGCGNFSATTVYHTGYTGETRGGGGSWAW